MQKSDATLSIKKTGKILWKPGTVLAPVPVVLVTCQGPETEPNVLTVAWTGTICSEPPVVSISVRPERYSYTLLREHGEFVVNMPTVDMVKAVDMCGVISGRTVNKFEKAGLTKIPSRIVSVPSIKECPINIECKVRQQIALGSHIILMGEVMCVQVTPSCLTKSGKFSVEKARLLAFAHGEYFELGKKIGYFGFSVRKSKTSQSSRY